jgi:hypothetical protein
MNFRRFQVFANKALYDCQDSRDDIKDERGGIIRHGVDLFPAIEEGQSVSLLVKGQECRGDEVSIWIVDTSEL